MSLLLMEQETAEESGAWIINELRQYGEPHPGALEVLRQPAVTIADAWSKEQITEYTNAMVPLVRHVVASKTSRAWLRSYKEQQKSLAQAIRHLPIGRDANWRDKYLEFKPVRVRAGLWLPTGWAVRYDRIYRANLPWVLSPILQNSFQLNEFAGETVLWENRVT